MFALALDTRGLVGHAGLCTDEARISVELVQSVGPR